MSCSSKPWTTTLLLGVACDEAVEFELAEGLADRRPADAQLLGDPQLGQGCARACSGRAGCRSRRLLVDFRAQRAMPGRLWACVIPLFV